jgi:1-acyl-sn-glycerol-3-phosphate acyltransferase
MSTEETNRPNQLPFRLPLRLQIWRATLRFVFRVIFRILCRIRVNGFEHVPLGTPYIIAYNHVSLLEPPMVLAFWPEIPEAVAGADVFERPGQKILVRAYRAIPVHRGEYDRAVIDTMLEILRVGRPLVIAPEGGRSHEPALRRARAGVAYLVDRAQVPVVPVGIVGTSDDTLKEILRGRRPRLEMNIGKPFMPPPIEGQGAARREARQENADMVMRRIAELIPEAYRGVYK